MDNLAQTIMENPVQTMFARHQQHFLQTGNKRISYHQEYKIAAID